MWGIDEKLFLRASLLAGVSHNVFDLLKDLVFVVRHIQSCRLEEFGDVSHMVETANWGESNSPFCHIG